MNPNPDTGSLKLSPINLEQGYDACKKIKELFVDPVDLVDRSTITNQYIDDVSNIRLLRAFIICLQIIACLIAKILNSADPNAFPLWLIFAVCSSVLLIICCIHANPLWHTSPDSFTVCDRILSFLCITFLYTQLVFSSIMMIVYDHHHIDLLTIIFTYAIAYAIFIIIDSITQLNQGTMIQNIIRYEYNPYVSIIIYGVSIITLGFAAFYVYCLCQPKYSDQYYQILVFATISHFIRFILLCRYTNISDKYRIIYSMISDIIGLCEYSLYLTLFAKYLLDDCMDAWQCIAIKVMGIEAVVGQFVIIGIIPFTRDSFIKKIYYRSLMHAIMRFAVTWLNKSIK
jgi:hypothetical protein